MFILNNYFTFKDNNMEKLTTDNMTGVHEGPANPNKPLKYLTAKSIIGDHVHDDNDQHIGKIQDIMIDINDGSIDYVVVDFGGFLGIGIKYFAIPFSLLRVDPEKKLFVFRGQKEMLKDAPGFDLDHWPDTNFHNEDLYWNF
jgi:sporulation protein YlmC with PRC-barrel domain